MSVKTNCVPSSDVYKKKRRSSFDLNQRNEILNPYFCKFRNQQGTGQSFFLFEVLSPWP